MWFKKKAIDWPSKNVLGMNTVFNILTQFGKFTLFQVRAEFDK